jgi:hypothetical protein
MTEEARPTKKLGSWLRRNSLTLVAALGGAIGVACGAGWGLSSSDKAAETTPASPLVIAESPKDEVLDTVQIALLLDTSGSMDGLINQARSHLWNMVDQMGRMNRTVNGKTRGVKIELALYEYGNDTIPEKDGYIRQVIPFTGDLDSVSEKLHALFTNGGSEYAGQAIETAVTKLQWSSDPNAMKFVFVAGNEEFDQGPVTAAKAMQIAAGKDINVQLIFCGTQDATWEAAAKLAKSDLMKIDQNQVAVHIPSPQDDEILKLGDELNGTYMAYGSDGQAASMRQSKADFSSAKMSKKVAVERAQLKSKKAYKNDSWDVVDATEKNSKFLETASDDKLPAPLKGKSFAEKKEIVAANAAKRMELKGKIAKLEAQRTTFIEAERKKQKNATEESLETELMKSTKKVATKKGYKF